MKTALITGATSGIGREFALQLSKMSYRLILTGRRTQRLEELEKELKTPVRIISADLEKEEDCYRLLESIKGEKIDIFINNAGFGACGSFLETDLKKEISMIHVNDIAMHILFKGVLQMMQKRNDGRILNVASSAGLLPGGPYMAGYYASKAYVTSLTRAVAAELSQMGSSVYVGALCPGPVNTEFNDKADVVFALKGISPQKCVKEAILGIMNKKIIIVPSIRMKFAMFFQKIVPTNLLVKMTGHQQRKKFKSR
ncbi:SDR family NAD(P)-dependent oxidoreductase [Butyrivibrio sp. NC3005]|uniref:SDR family NAD(P)-dependent oxidoreductase n=1 Tax=Butyrivibrio sp. NC3005 TaxID=1280685 RepID=UPI0003F55713|nr:SDR family oxidoreductase [Butyrivibrio sp. NC3005]